MPLLLNDQQTYHLFFSLHFERSSLHIQDSHRSNRLAWTRIHRRFIPNHDIDAILNVTARQPSFNIPHHVQLMRYNLAQSTWQHFPPQQAPQLPALQSAFRDGFELVLHHMHLSSPSIARFTDALHQFWHVPIQVSLHFCPPAANTKQLADPLAASLRPGDTFLVVLDGEAQAVLYDQVHQFPLSDELRHESHSILSKIVHQPQLNFALYEGDVLYVPRGSASNVLATKAPVLYLAFHIRTDQQPVTLALHSILSAARKTEHSPLNELADSTLKWSDIVSKAIVVAHDVVPPLRRFLPISGDVAEALQDAGKSTALQVTVDVLSNFAVAAVDALFHPFVDAVASREVDFGDELYQWAFSLRNGSHKSSRFKRANQMFAFCVNWLARQKNAPKQGVFDLMVERVSNLTVEREKNYEARDEEFKSQIMKEQAFEEEFLCKDDKEYCMSSTFR